MRHHNLYRNKQWIKGRLKWLKYNPFCQFCGEPGNVVDHITPHKGDLDLFYDMDNWQTLCKICHDNAKRRIENRGYEHGSSATGDPIDPMHPWNNEFD